MAASIRVDGGTPVDYMPIRVSRILFGMTMTFGVAVLPLGAAWIWSRSSTNPGEAVGIGLVGLAMWLVLSGIFFATATILVRSARRPAHM